MARLVNRASTPPDYIPGTDYVSLIQQINSLPDADVQQIGGEAGPRGTAAKAVMRARMGLGERITPAALAIPSSFPSSSVLRQIQGSPDGDPISLQPAPDRPTVAGAMPPPSRPVDPPPPPTPVTPQPISPEAGVGLQAPSATPAPVAPSAPAPATPTEEDDEISKDRNFAIMQAGLAILASKNRSGLGAIGEGALVGLQGYQDSKQTRRKEKRDERVLARQEEQAAKQMDMQIQRMELEKQLSQDKMALAREEMDITRSRYDPSNPLNAAQIERDRAAAAASQASAWKARQPDSSPSGGGGGGGGVNFGKSAQGLAIARLVNDGVLTPEEGALHLAQKTITLPNGEVVMRSPGDGLAQLRGPDLSTQEKNQVVDSDKAAETALSVKDNLNTALGMNKDAYSGFTAEARAWADRNLLPGEQKRGTATTDYKNIIESQSVANLKNAFPGQISNDERKAFSELQASVNKSPEEREAILKRAIAASEAVAAREAARAGGIRQGTYFEPGAGPRVPSSAPASPAAPAAKTRLVFDPATGEFKPK